MADVKVTDADRARAEAFAGIYEHNMDEPASVLLAAQFAEVREDAAKVADGFARGWRALLAQYQSAEYPIHAHIEMAAAQAQTYEAVAAAIRPGELRG